MARDVGVLSRRGKIARASLSVYGVAIYLFLFFPIVLLVLFSFNANRYGSFPITGWTFTWYRQMWGDFEIRGALVDEPQGRCAGDRDLDHRRHGRGIPARALEAAVPQRRPDHLHPADHDPRPPDRGLACSCCSSSTFHWRSLARDGGDRPVGLHDAVRDPARVGQAPGLRHVARASGRRSRREHVPAAAPDRPAAAAAGDHRGRALRVHALAGRIHHHVLPDRRREHAPDLHLHADQVRYHSRGQRAGVGAARRVADAPCPRVCACRNSSA